MVVKLRIFNRVLTMSKILSFTTFLVKTFYSNPLSLAKKVIGETYILHNIGVFGLSAILSVKKSGTYDT